jgi:hypothetical protein
MNSTVTAMLLACSLMLVTAFLLSRLPDLKRSYYMGVSMWSRWLPVCAIGIYLAVLAVNLVAGAGPRNPIGMAGYFSTLELAVFFVVGPLFLTRLGNLLATATILYFLERLVINTRGFDAPLSLYLLTGAATIIALLADKMPWLSHDGPSILAHKFREIMLTFLTLAAMGVVFAAILKVNELSRWMATLLAISLPNTVVLGLLVGLFLGWLSVAVGYTRHFTIPLLCLPSIFILAFVTAWPSYLLVIPFTTCVALSLASADRREGGRRRVSGFGPGFLAS